MARRLPAFGKSIVDRRKAGERIGLVVLSLHDWNSGLWFDGRPEVVRAVVPSDLAFDAADLTFLLALDVVVCGEVERDVFDAGVRAVIAAGAASCWGEFAEGVALLGLIGRGKVVSLAVPVPTSKLGAAMAEYRRDALALRAGIYGSKAFDAVRAAMFGPLLAELNGAVCEAYQ